MNKVIYVILATTLVLVFVIGSYALADSLKQSTLTLSPLPRTPVPLDPQNVLVKQISGAFELTVDVDKVPRKYKVYIPQGAERNFPGIVILPDSGQDPLKFIVESGWKDIADKNRIYLFILEPKDNMKWDVEGNEEKYVNAVQGKAITPYHESKIAHLIGYGDAGTIVQKIAIKNPRAWSSIGSFGQLDISEEYMSQMGAQPTAEENVPTSEIPLPVWIVTDGKINASTQKVIDYWKKANDSSEKSFSNSDADYIYMPSPIINYNQLNKENIAQVRVTIKPKNHWNDPAFSEVTWEDFHSLVRRMFGIGNGGLRVYASPEEYGAVRRFMHFAALDSKIYNSQWYEYVPASVKNHPEKAVPLVIAAHGGSGTGLLEMVESGWFKLAEDRGFIVAFPSYKYVSYPDIPKFVPAIIADIKSRNTIDAGRVYVTGFSGGGMVSLITALTCSDVVTAVGSTSGMPPSFDANWLKDFTLNEDHDIPFMMMLGANGDLGLNNMNNPVYDALIKYWTTRYRTNGVNDASTFQSGPYNNFVYYNNQEIPMVHITSIDNRGHSTSPEESYIFYDQWFSNFYRNADGKIVYQGNKVFKKM